MEIIGEITALRGCPLPAASPEVQSKPSKLRVFGSAAAAGALGSRQQASQNLPALHRERKSGFREGCFIFFGQ